MINTLCLEERPFKIVVRKCSARIRVGVISFASNMTTTWTVSQIVTQIDMQLVNEIPTHKTVRVDDNQLSSDRQRVLYGIQANCTSKIILVHCRTSKIN